MMIVTTIQIPQKANTHVFTFSVKDLHNVCGIKWIIYGVCVCVCVHMRLCVLLKALGSDRSEFKF